MHFVNSTLDSINSHLDLAVRLAPAACSWSSDTYSANNSHHNYYHMANYRQKTGITPSRRTPSSLFLEG